MAFFGLKLGLDLEMRAAHPHQKFQAVPPGEGGSKFMSRDCASRRHGLKAHQAIGMFRRKK